MLRNILTIIAAGLLLSINSCSDKGVAPKIETEIQPGTRDYEWSIDTVRIFSNLIFSAWGSAPDDVWGVGPGGALNTTIWHYDGKKWQTDKISRPVAPNCVYGFAKNDVWIAGYDGEIWHYDGHNWSKNYQHTINGFTGIKLWDLHGTSSRDLYAVGCVWFDHYTRRGIILHYNGVKWEQKYLADFNSFFGIVRTDSKGRCVIGCVKQDVKYNSNDTLVFYEFDGKNLKKFYTDENWPVRGGWMASINGDILVSSSTGIHKYTGDTLHPLIKYSQLELPGSIVGRNEKDIFVYKKNGISHFNGTDIKPVYPIGNGWFYCGVAFAKDVFLFVTMTDSPATFIYHGKMK